MGQNVLLYEKILHFTIIYKYLQLLFTSTKYTQKKVFLRINDIMTFSTEIIHVPTLIKDFLPLAM